MKNSTINKKEIDKFSKMAEDGGILKENLNHYINLIL